MWCKVVCAGLNLHRSTASDAVLVGSSAISMCMPLVSINWQLCAVMGFEIRGLDKLTLLRTVLQAARTGVVPPSNSFKIH